MDKDSTSENGSAPAGNASRKAPQKAMRAPPVRKTDAVCAEICQRLSLGETLVSILEDDHMPAMSKVFEWLNRDQSFREKYARARMDQADVLAEKVLELAADAHDSETAQVAKVNIDAVKWFNSKVYPKKYGEKAGDVHVTTAIGVVLPEEKRVELIERQRAAEALPEK